MTKNISESIFSRAYDEPCISICNKEFFIPFTYLLYFKCQFDQRFINAKIIKVFNKDWKCQSDDTPKQVQTCTKKKYKN